jgi:hypothetical protein
VRVAVACMRWLLSPDIQPGIGTLPTAGCRGVDGPGPSASLDVEELALA